MSAVLPVDHADTRFGYRRPNLDLEADSGAGLTISIGNIFKVRSAYGVAAAEALNARIEPVVGQLQGLGCRLLARGPGFADILFEHGLAKDIARITEALAVRMALDPVTVDGAHVHASLNCDPWTSGEGRARRPSPDHGTVEGEDWASSYRRDMALAAKVLGTLRDGHPRLAWQPVVAAGPPERCLYHEGLVRLFDERGACLPAGDVAPALERVGLMRAFDHEIVAAVLDELEASTGAALGVNISGQSARVDGWWLSLFERLKSPDVARRLVIEITETAALAPGAPAFVAALRKLGCRVALDDFGAGHASVRNAIALSPDIVKLTPFFLRNVALSPSGGAMFAHLVGVAGAIAPVVVIEGIETAAQAQFASDTQGALAPGSGDRWQQGYLFGRPSLWRSWRHSQDEPRPKSLANPPKRPPVFRPGLPASLGKVA